VVSIPPSAAEAAACSDFADFINRAAIDVPNSTVSDDLPRNFDQPFPAGAKAGLSDMDLNTSTTALATCLCTWFRLSEKRQREGK
jgi:hypothetical protein